MERILKWVLVLMLSLSSISAYSCDPAPGDEGRGTCGENDKNKVLYLLSAFAIGFGIAIVRESQEQDMSKALDQIFIKYSVPANNLMAETYQYDKFGKSSVSFYLSTFETAYSDDLAFNVRWQF